ncbi:MAG TPA: GAF domain-containing protein, partial [Spongiibacteraceae bacterium]|nr:GAF domain-containing protein [Spongiibacteraceae bacterium]
MGLSSPEMALLAVESLTALALVALWVGDRERTYTLWWAISFGIAPLPSLLIGHGRAHEGPVVIALCLNVAVQAATLIAGVISYRFQRPLSVPNVGMAIVALTALYYLPISFVGFMWSRFALIVSMTGALLTSAVLLWSLGRFEKLAAACFALSGGLEIFRLMLVIAGQLNSTWLAHIPSFSGLMAICTALALLIAAYQRSLDQLRDQNRFLELSHEITEQLQGVSDETSLAQRVLSVITQRLEWQQGMFFQPVGEPESLSLIPVASCGELENTLVKIGLPVATPNTGMIAEAVRSKRVCYSEGLNKDPRLTEAYRDHPLVKSNPSLVVIPVTHDGKVLGIIALHDVKRRELRDTEIRTLE